PAPGPGPPGVRGPAPGCNAALTAPRVRSADTSGALPYSKIHFEENDHRGTTCRADPPGTLYRFLRVRRDLALRAGVLHRRWQGDPEAGHRPAGRHAGDADRAHPGRLGAVEGLAQPGAPD